MTTSKKTCFKCNQNKSLGDFYKHPEMKDGNLNKCKECAKGDVKQYRRSPEHREKVLAYDRKRGSRQSKEYNKKLKTMKPKETKARNMVSNAIRDGRLIRPSRCEHCGSDQRLHGHHYDYDKPLSVIWLCVPCHKQVHAYLDLVSKKELKAG